jgi:hypothetical protein
MRYLGLGVGHLVVPINPEMDGETDGDEGGEPNVPVIPEILDTPLEIPDNTSYKFMETDDEELEEDEEFEVGSTGDIGEEDEDGAADEDEDEGDDDEEEKDEDDEGSWGEL